MESKVVAFRMPKHTFERLEKVKRDYHNFRKIKDWSKLLPPITVKSQFLVWAIEEGLTVIEKASRINK